MEKSRRFIRPAKGDVSLSKVEDVFVVVVGGVKHLSLTVEQTRQLAKLLAVLFDQED